MLPKYYTCLLTPLSPPPPPPSPSPPLPPSSSSPTYTAPVGTPHSHHSPHPLLSLTRLIPNVYPLTRKLLPFIPFHFWVANSCLVSCAVTKYMSAFCLLSSSSYYSPHRSVLSSLFAITLLLTSLSRQLSLTARNRKVSALPFFVFLALFITLYLALPTPTSSS